jgi:hypothetical protein
MSATIAGGAIGEKRLDEAPTAVSPAADLGDAPGGVDYRWPAIGVIFGEDYVVDPSLYANANRVASEGISFQESWCRSRFSAWSSGCCRFWCRLR